MGVSFYFFFLHYLYWQWGLQWVDFQTRSMENQKQAQESVQSSNSLQNLPTKSRVEAYVFEMNQNPACPPSWKRTRQRMRCNRGLIKFPKYALRTYLFPDFGPPGARARETRF